MSVTSPSDFTRIWQGRGFYLIATDFQPDLEKKSECSLRLAGLSVIYRGQADKVGERVQSHLNNIRYKEKKKKDGGQPWPRCLKLDRNPGNGGIDFDRAPYNDSKWSVLVLPLRHSTSAFRDFAEWGFDFAYGKPIASNESAKGPDSMQLITAREERRKLAQAAVSGAMDLSIKR